MLAVGVCFLFVVLVKVVMFPSPSETVLPPRAAAGTSPSDAARFGGQMAAEDPETAEKTGNVGGHWAESVLGHPDSWASEIRIFAARASGTARSWGEPCLRNGAGGVAGL